MSEIIIILDCSPVIEHNAKCKMIPTKQLIFQLKIYKPVCKIFP